jgi:hypothetical protein
MRHVTAVTIRCGNELCSETYQISLSSNKERHDDEIRFADCPHCRHARDEKALVEYWGKERCWGCHIPFLIYREEAMGLCYVCYISKWKQKKLFLSKVTQKGII